MNLVFVLLHHLESAKNSFTCSGSLMFVVLATCFRAWILDVMVSSALPSLRCANKKLVMSCAIGCRKISARSPIPADVLA